MGAPTQDPPGQSLALVLAHDGEEGARAEHVEVAHGQHEDRDVDSPMAWTISRETGPMAIMPHTSRPRRRGG